MYYVYIVQSEKDGTRYIGYTADLKKRMQEHNNGKTSSLKHKVPVSLMYYEAYRTKTLARKREIELKNHSAKKEALFLRLFNTTARSSSG